MLSGGDLEYYIVATVTIKLTCSKRLPNTRWSMQENNQSFALSNHQIVELR